MHEHNKTNFFKIEESATELIHNYVRFFHEYILF